MSDNQIEQRNLKVSVQRISDRDRLRQHMIFERDASLAARFGEDRRGSYAATCALTPTADGVTFTKVSGIDVKGWWVMPASHDPSHAVLFIHGGGYHVGDAMSYRGLASQIASRAHCPVFAVDYSLAPEERFPSAHEAAVRARDWLVAGGAKEYSMIGDSAGGGLVLSLLNDLRPDHRPASVAVFSPWTDLALTGASFNDPETHDPVFKPDSLAALAQLYLNGADPRDPRASPLYEVPLLLPPILIQVGTDELLLDDAKRYAEAAAHQGSEVKLELFEGLHHVFQRDAGSLAIADQALDQAVQFVTNHWNSRFQPTPPKAGKEFK